MVVGCARLMNAQIISCEEESVGSMGQNTLSKLAVMMDAPTKLKREESAGGTAQSSKDAVKKDAPTLQ